MTPIQIQAMVAILAPFAIQAAKASQVKALGWIRQNTKAVNIGVSFLTALITSAGIMIHHTPGQIVINYPGLPQSISTANGQGYVATNLYAPTASGNDTVTFSSAPNSANLTSLCSGNFVALCSDINGNARPTMGGWQSGAYEFAGTGYAVTTLGGIKVQGVTLSK